MELVRTRVDRRASAQPTATSGETMSSRFTRHGVPSMTSRQPSHRIATLSLTIVRIVTPMISIAARIAGRRVDRWYPQPDSNRRSPP